MRQIQIDASQIDKLDIGKLGKQIRVGMQPNPMTGLKRPIFKAAMGISPYAGSSEIVDIAEDQIRFQFISPKKTPIGFLRSPSPPTYYTFALGLTGGHAMVVGPVVGAGAYGSTNGEIGLFSGVGFQIQTNIGASGSVEFTMIFGPPSSFQGTSIAIGVDVGPSVLCGSGMLIFSTSGGFLGFSFSVGAGFSVLPANLTIQVSHTSLKPLIQARP